MQYTIENYKKSELPKIGDRVKIGQFTFSIEEGSEGGKYYLNGISCANDAAFCYTEENKYSFAQKAVKGYGTAFNSGICPYISSLAAMAILIKALWDKADSKESESGLLMHSDVVNIGPFQYQICKYHNEYFLRLDNRNEIKEKFGDTSGGNDAIFRLLQIDKNYFFSSILKDGCSTVSEESMACPYAKTLEGINKIITALQKEYNDFVSRKKKTTKWTKAEPKPCRACDSTSSKDINITIPKKSNPVKLKIVL